MELQHSRILACLSVHAVAWLLCFILKMSARDTQGGHLIQHKEHVF